ncbi:MAG: lactoylglutathione lyase [Parcubacteria group bacterium CG11_big_fil_rev_8_21_14_0_20_39_22]|nr:MAG: lactoylglutathione lyase [Parcubacteria group bacterium CG11_big_fil_rev_8_21_14_0_20_39_22]
MIDHVSIKVSDLEESRKFYEKAFESLDYKIDFGELGVFWAFDVKKGLFEIIQANKDEEVMPIHVAFRVNSKRLVDSFYRSAIEAGGKDNGKPEPCPEYTKTYYAGFVFDPDGHNIEVMMD